MASKVRTLPWPQVLAIYEDRVADQGPAFEPMLALVRFLASTRYASPIHESLRQPPFRGIKRAMQPAFLLVATQRG